MRIVFMGSPALALPTLRAIVAAGHEIALVVTQIPRRAGRGLRETPPAVAVEAAFLGLPIYQPTTLRGESAQARIRAANPDVIVVLAYGRILPPQILSIPPFSCLNVHLSLLPRHRGASPVSAAILAGDQVTGVSVMLMEEGLDSGPVLAQAETPILSGDDQTSLTERLAALGAELLVQTLPRWASGTIQPTPQDQTLVTWTHPTTRADGLLNWDEPALLLWRRVRAYASWPQAFTRWRAGPTARGVGGADNQSGGRSLHIPSGIAALSVASGRLGPGQDERLLRILRADYDPNSEAPPGLVTPRGPGRRPKAVAIGTAQGVLLPLVVGLEGRRAASIDAFLQGYPAFVGAHL